MAANSRTAVSGRRTRTWLIGVYIRLSKEDARHLDESESVTNQRSIIEDYIASMDDGDEYRIVDEYVDDGISGTTDDERADFQRMLNDIRRGRVNCVIVKDLARSFRNYSDQGYYLDDWFPRYNVRFISLYHQPLDSYKEPKLMRSIAVPIQGVLNENHCAETSEKVREVFDMKRRNGEHIGSFAAYGWLKDPDNKNLLILDEVAAEVINDMADMVLNGMSLNKIAEYLNDHDVPCPSVYKRQTLGLKYYNPQFDISTKPLWAGTTIRRILTDRMLCGDLIQGRYRVKSYKVHIQERVPEEEWFIAENAIPAIMSREKFDKLQNALNRDTRRSPKEVDLYLFSGFLRCADCGRAMSRKVSGNIVYYMCKTYRDLSKKACTIHSIRQDRLEEAVLYAIQQQIYLAVDYTKLVDDINRAPAAKTQSKRLLDAIEQKEKELAKIFRYKQAIYQDWKDGEISQSEYRGMKADYERQTETINAAIEKLRKEEQELETGFDTESPCLAAFRQYGNIDRLTRDILIEFIDTIYIYEGGRISIKFRFADEFRKIQEYIELNSTKTTDQAVAFN